MDLPQLMKKQYSKAVELIENSTDIKIYTHIDCDGICSGAILSTILDRLEKPHDIEFVNLDVLDDLVLDHELTIFSDLGSGQDIAKNAKDGHKILILDHHPPLRDLDYGNDKEYTYLEINPLHHGIDGSVYICGGGLCYFLAKEFGYLDLSWIGVLSAIGDMQNNKTGHFEGLNRIIEEDAINQGYLDVTRNDLNIYGRSTRPLFIALSYFSDITLPITNNQDETMAILDELHIDSTLNDLTDEELEVLEIIGVERDEKNITLTSDEKYYVNFEYKKLERKEEMPYLTDTQKGILSHLHDRLKRKTLSQLNVSQKQRLVQKLIEMLSKEVPSRYVQYIPQLIFGDSYTFLMEAEHSSLRDGSEFSTAMNACGRNHEERVGLDILKGNRDFALDELSIVSRDHRYNLATSMQKVVDEERIIEMDNIQYFDGEGIKPEIVGTIAGMILGYCNWRKPVLGFSPTDDNLKVSLRCSKLLSYDGIHFGHVIRDAAGEVGGSGGGHAMACGAYIPHERKDEFLNIFNERLEGKIEK